MVAKTGQAPLSNLSRLPLPARDIELAYLERIFCTPQRQSLRCIGFFVTTLSLLVALSAQATERDELISQRH